MENNILDVYIKKGILIMLGLIIQEAYSYTPPQKLTAKMQSFFTQTLANTYGNEPEVKLYNLFLNDYKSKNGKVELNINRDELKKINQILFIDTNYYYFYPKILFYDSYNAFKSANNAVEIDKNAIVFFDKEDQNTTKYGMYFNDKGYFKALINSNAHLEMIEDINDYYFYAGVLSYFVFADIMLTDASCFENNIAKELTAVVFWKYLCDQSNISFYK